MNKLPILCLACLALPVFAARGPLPKAAETADGQVVASQAQSARPAPAGAAAKAKGASAAPAKGGKPAKKSR